MSTTERRATAAEKREREEDERTAKRRSAREIRRVSGQFVVVGPLMVSDKSRGFRDSANLGGARVAVVQSDSNLRRRGAASWCRKVRTAGSRLSLQTGKYENLTPPQKSDIVRTETRSPTPQWDPTAHVICARLDIFVPITGANLESDPVKLNRRPGGAHNAEDLDAEELRLQRDRENARRSMSAGMGGSVSSVRLCSLYAVEDCQSFTRVL